MTKEEQVELLAKARGECEEKMYKYYNKTLYEPPSKESRCGMVWDNVLCWDEAPAGELVKQRCPNYIHGFNSREYASKQCGDDGEWLYNPIFNTTWTNFSSCDKHSTDLTFHFDRLRLLYSIGYGISLASLIIAVSIMLCCSRLKSKSNTLHLNLFFAFMLRAALSFLKEALFVNGVGFEKDIEREVNGELHFIEEGSHWECRLLVALFNYSICVSQMWIFTEGLYLHMLIYRTLYTDRKGVKFYIYLGWLSPLLFFLPWAIVKAVNDNTYCWNINTHAGYLWIMHGPLMATVVVNCFFFLDILRVLCTRVRANQRHAGRTQYRRLAKFILVLIPLFGVMYIIFYVSFPSTGFEMEVDMTQLYIEMTYNSFQGFILSLLFCFLNEEVHAELKRMWYRRQSRRSDSIVLTRSFVLSSWKKTSYQTNRNIICDKDQLPDFSRHSKIQNEDMLTRLKSRAMYILKKDTQVQNGGNVTPCNGNLVIRDESLSDMSQYVNNKSDDSISPESV